MKKIIVLTVCMLCAIQMQAGNITVYDAQGNGIKYTVSDVPLFDAGNNPYIDAKLTGLTGIGHDFMGALVIPTAWKSTYLYSGTFLDYRVTAIASYACSSNSNTVKSLTIPNTVTSIGSNAFSGCPYLETVTVSWSDPSVVSYGIYIFGDASNMTLNFPTGRESAYREITPWRRFENFGGGGDFEIVDGVLVEYYGVGGDVAIPDGVTSFSSSIFRYSEELTSITIPKSVTSIGGKFYGATNLSSINVESDNPNYSSEDGVLFNKDKTTLICYPAGKTGSYTVPNSVTSIENDAFRDCISLASITISNFVTSIGDDIPFSDCTNLSSINVESDNPNYSSEDGVLFNKDKTTLIYYPAGKTGNAYIMPNSVISIENDAFYENGKLTSIVFSDKVSSIGEKCFARSGLTSLTLPKSLVLIEYFAFIGCVNLKDVTVFWKNPSDVAFSKYGGNPFEDVNISAVTLHVPSGTKAAYQAADVWKDFYIVDDATGIADIKPHSLQVYPNPATDFITVSGLQTNETIRLFDLNGRLLISRRATSEKEMISVSHLPAGWYVVRVSSGQTVKLVKR
jgi:hypothetical protein